ncbi:putative domain HDIG-containing protein [Halobacteroides halobius DSM 5150]|uniref:Putative domain HDIG-containing protein n=1 Tax=Halobacteroides halobius (strain ATCC 35273 / DSM 5150 / MD-1) TaxID=748449 RepID=L0KCL5_HALHC|nr:HDIG domain-containing metalloprotein [Halobacteroides halobius]AGB41798.1 putative domain HDIG-containing protein [Halobacteroides halobius DSM 5150]
MKLWGYMVEKVEESKFDFYKNKLFQQLVWGIFVFLVLALLITIDFLPDRVDLEVGQVSDNDIKAPKTIKYIDHKRTEELKEEAADAVSKVYEEDVTVLREIKKEVNHFFALVKDFRKRDSKLEIRVSNIKARTKLRLAREDYTYLLKLKLEKINNLKEDILAILVKYLTRGVKSDYLAQVKEQMKREVSKIGRSRQYNQLVKNITQQTIEPNLILDLRETRKRKERAKERIKPVKRTIHKGEIIIRHGRVVTEKDVQKLKLLGLRDPKVDYSNIIGYSVIILIMLGVIIIYIYQYHRQVLNNMSQLYLLGLLPIIILLLARLANYLPTNYPSFLVPIAAASILVAVLVDTDIAIIFTVGLSFLVAIVSDETIADIAVAMISGISGIYSVTKLSQRSDLVRAGFIVGGASSLTIFAFLLTNPVLELVSFLKIVPLGIINGVVVAIITNGLLPYVENIFGITSPVKLLELSNPNHPLLKRLLVKAPGTYHHSIIVGNLAEAAADTVEADSLLARVGAYYHDIGKIKRSYFFIENQIGDENPHDKLSPNLSTLIITSHVKDGVEMANNYKLPEVIVDIIKQHHGESLVSYFYQEAAYDDKYENVDESEFRYPGPRPQTKEAALIMLADTVEAAVRSNIAVQSNPDKLEKFVTDLIKAKLNSGQLDESDLTLKDLDKIASSFVNILKGIFHNRIEYPDNIAQQFKEGEAKNDSSN